MYKEKTDYCDEKIEYRIEKRENAERIIKEEGFPVAINVSVCAHYGYEIFNN